MRTHMFSQTGESPFNCTVCDAELKKHMLNHTGEKPIYCNICEANGWKFLNYGTPVFHKGNLKTNRLKHTGYTPFNNNILGSKPLRHTC